MADASQQYQFLSVDCTGNKKKKKIQRRMGCTSSPPRTPLIRLSCASQRFTTPNLNRTDFLPRGQGVPQPYHRNPRHYHTTKYNVDVGKLNKNTYHIHTHTIQPPNCREQHGTTPSPSPSPSQTIKPRTKQNKTKVLPEAKLWNVPHRPSSVMGRQETNYMPISQVPLNCTVQLKRDFPSFMLHTVSKY